MTSKEVKGQWTIKRSAGILYKMEDYIFLRHIQDIRMKADDKYAALRSWLLEEIKIYWTMGDETLIEFDEHEYEEDSSWRSERMMIT
jgi:hypothetical protein